MTYYAKNDQLSDAFIDGGIEITEMQHNAAVEAKMNGQETDVIDGELIIYSATTRKVYSTETGEELEIPENRETPEGHTDTERPSFMHEWVGDEWSLNDEMLIEQLKTARDNLWRTSTITLSNGAILKVNDRTRSDVSDTYDGLMAAGLTEYAGWRAENGVYTMTLELFQESKVLALQVVGKAFTAFNTVIDTHSETPYTNLQDAVDAMTALFEEEE